jgi:hypothetical protein
MLTQHAAPNTRYDYDVMARAVVCPQCCAEVGKKCWGAYDRRVGYSHAARRRLASKQRAREKRRRPLSGA